MKILLGVIVLLGAVAISPSARAESVCRGGIEVDLNAWNDSLVTTPDPNIESKLEGDLSKCQEGDVVWLPSILVYLIAKTCDFSKQIVVLPQRDNSDPYSASTVCIVGAPKSEH
jgi:hypothetical protein